MQPSSVKKHTMDVDGHKTSVSLEDAFWSSLKEIAYERRESTAHLVTSINADRKFANLSSGIRLFVLDFYKERLARLQRIEQAEIFSGPIS
jgi:predicted DNA-binding ribbon-helix-helix protein